MSLINGVEQDTLPVSDRATQFGDGCFTTARIRHGKVEWLDAHLHRLQANCQALLIPFHDAERLADEMQAQAAGHDDGVLKVSITRGSGGRGYSLSGCSSPTRILTVSPYPAHYPRWQQEGISLILSPVRLGRNPHLAGLKHLNRLEQVLIRAHLEQTEADEALVLDSEGWVTECCAANIFWRAGDTVFTPRVDQAGVNGLLRQRCLGWLAQSRFRVVEVNARTDAVSQADEVLLCNALMPLVPVNTFGDVRYLSRTLFDTLKSRYEQSITT